MTHMISTKNQPFLKNMNIPSNLNDIKPRSTYLRNYYYIGFDTMEGGTRLSVFTSYFKVKNVEGENWRASTILVHVTCIYPIQCKMIHATHHCAPIKGVL